MAGIYIHIPFCKSRCAYCDFFSTTLLDRRLEYVESVLQEIDLRQDEIQKEPIKTIYLGGGTPSMLETEQIAQILHKLPLESAQEITIEANPGDITREKLADYRSMGINRLSIGIQSFNDKHLRILGRRHSAQEAMRTVRLAQEVGFKNISIDLIYGVPGQTMEEWKANVEQALQLDIQHISTYNLIYEEGTCITQQLERGEIQAQDEEVEIEMYEYLVKTLIDNGFEHYEVSNFCKPDYESKHNSAYWTQTNYVGLGAGAHSLREQVRSWNVADLNAYIEQINAGVLPYESEKLSAQDVYNEIVMLSLRTKWGIDLNILSAEEQTYCLKQADKYLQDKLLIQEKGHIIASIQGIEILNRIIADLML